MGKFICKYCGKECKNKNSLVQHEIRCKENPNRIKSGFELYNDRGHKGYNQYTKEDDVFFRTTFSSSQLRTSSIPLDGSVDWRLLS